MILWIDINYLEECIQINALGYSIYLLSVFRVGKLLIMIERKIIRFTYYPIGLLYQLKVTVKSSFGTNNRAGSQGSDQIRKIKLCQETRYQMLDRIRKRSPPLLIWFCHHQNPFKCTTQKIVIYKGIDRRIQNS